MIIAIILIFLVFIGLVTQKYDSKLYIIFCLCCLAGTYLLVNPTSDFDLYRHYEIYDIVQSLELKEVFQERNYLNNTFTGLLFNQYVTGSPVYIFFVFLCSRIAGHKLLIIVTTILVYGIPMYVIYSVGRDKKYSNGIINLSVIFLILSINYLDVSGIRNLLAVSIVCGAAFLDLVKKEKKYLAICGYICALMIHNSVAIVILFRLILLVKSNLIQRICVFITLFSVILLVEFKEQGFYVDNMGYIGDFINNGINRLYNYVVGGGSSVSIVSSNFLWLNLVARIASMVSIAIIFFRTKNMGEKFEQYDKFLLLIGAFVMSATVQYDLFVRMQFFLVVFVTPKLPSYFELSTGNKISSIKCKSAFSTLSLCLLIVLENVLFWLISYRALDSCIF